MLFGSYNVSFIALYSKIILRNRRHISVTAHTKTLTAYILQAASQQLRSVHLHLLREKFKGIKLERRSISGQWLKSHWNYSINLLWYTYTHTHSQRRVAKWLNGIYLCRNYWLSYYGLCIQIEVNSIRLMERSLHALSLSLFSLASSWFGIVSPWHSSLHITRSV